MTETVNCFSLPKFDPEPDAKAHPHGGFSLYGDAVSHRVKITPCITTKGHARRTPVIQNELFRIIL